MKFKPLLPVGTELKIDKSRIENLLNKKLLDGLPNLIQGNVIDYKMTDGKGIGYIIMTKNNLKLWIFDNELDQKTKIDYQINTFNNINQNDLISGRHKVNYQINGNRTITTIANPINLVNWLMFTLKDIF